MRNVFAMMARLGDLCYKECMSVANFIFQDRHAV